MIVSSVNENCLPIEQRVERELTWKNHLREFTTKRLRVKGSSTDSTTRVRQPRISSPSATFLSRASNPGNFCLQHERLPSTRDPRPLSRNLCPPYFEELGLTLVRADSTIASSGVAPAASAPAATGLLLKVIESPASERCGLLDRPAGSGGDEVCRIEGSGADMLLLLLVPVMGYVGRLRVGRCERRKHVQFGLMYTRDRMSAGCANITTGRAK